MKLNNPPTPEQIKALAALPHGQKDAVIKANGLWDYPNDPDYQQYDVELTAMVEMEAYGNTTIWAKSVSDARDVANKLSANDIDWSLDDTYVGGNDVDRYTVDTIILSKD